METERHCFLFLSDLFSLISYMCFLRLFDAELTSTVCPWPNSDRHCFTRQYIYLERWTILSRVVVAFAVERYCSVVIPFLTFTLELKKKAEWKQVRTHTQINNGDFLSHHKNDDDGSRWRNEGILEEFAHARCHRLEIVGLHRIHTHTQTHNTKATSQRFSGRRIHFRYTILFT